MNFTIGQIAQWINGNVVGDPEALIYRFAPIQEANEGSISFLANPKYEKFLFSTKASCVIVDKPYRGIATSLIEVKNAYEAFALLLRKYQDITSEAFVAGVHPSAQIEANVSIHENVRIGPSTTICENVEIAEGVEISGNSYIGKGVKIGKGTRIYSNVSIYHDTVVGEYCTIHAGVCLGSDGFGFARGSSGVYSDIPQLGNVILKNHVSIGANSTVDRATMGSTIIGEGVKIDNLVQVGHNVQIGDHTVIAALTGVSGSTQIGKYCTIGGQVGMVGHIKIADGTRVAAKTGINSDILEKNTTVSGIPHQSYNDDLKAKVIFKKLPELLQRIEKLENSNER